MFRMRAKTASLWQRFTRTPEQGSEAPDALAMNASVLAQAIHSRSKSGEQTTLRQLHKIARLSQSEALRAAVELERSGKALIDHQVHDALESTVTLTEAMRSSIEANASNDTDVVVKRNAP